MKKLANLPNKQAGAMMLEALISILIFSIGILAIVGLQATSIKQSSDAKYRSDASLLASELISDMWTSNRTYTTLQTDFQSGGTRYNQWLNDVNATLPGVSGVTANQPVIQIVSAVSATAATSVTITIYWNSPSETPKAHNYVAVAKII